VIDGPKLRRPKTPAPDGEPKQPSRDRDSTVKSKVTDVQDPLIAGNAGRAGKCMETDEANVDEAGHIRRKRGEVDLLH
jgi:hypothetical protein